MGPSNPGIERIRSSSGSTQKLANFLGGGGGGWVGWRSLKLAVIDVLWTEKVWRWWLPWSRRGCARLRGQFGPSEAHLNK